MAGCGLAVEAGACNKLRIKTTPAGAYVFSAVTSVNLIPQAYGCGFTLVTAVTPFEFVTNDCGVVVGFEAGTATTFASDVALPVSRCTALCGYCNPWWCVSGSCVQALTSPVGATGGPYSTQADCLSACSPPPDPWWCVGGSCVQAATAPIGSTGGPYSSSTECSAVCYTPPTPCDGSCVWSWGESGWTLLSSSCGSGCECVVPAFSGLSGDSAATTCITAYAKPIGKCWDGTGWVACETVTALSMMEAPTI